jgi:hypothetical protein
MDSAVLAKGTRTEGDPYDTGLRIRNCKVIARPPHHYRHYTTLFLHWPEEFPTEVREGELCDKPWFEIGFTRPDGVWKATHSGWRTREEAEAARQRFTTGLLGTQFEVGMRDGCPWGKTWADPKLDFAPLCFVLTEEEAAPVIAFRQEMDIAWRERSAAWIAAEDRLTEAQAHAAALDSLSESTLHRLHGPLECLECGATFTEPGHVEPGGMGCDRCNSSYYQGTTTMASTPKRTVRITWVERGTRNAACLGLDETIETDWTITECREAALHRGSTAGIDLDRYDVNVEEV